MSCSPSQTSMQSVTIYILYIQQIFTHKNVPLLDYSIFKKFALLSIARFSFFFEAINIGHFHLHISLFLFFFKCVKLQVGNIDR